MIPFRTIYDYGDGPLPRERHRGRWLLLAVLAALVLLAVAHG